MDANSRTFFNGILVARLRKLQPELWDEVSGVENRNAAGPMDEVDLACERSQKEFSLMIRLHKSRNAREIQDALKRLEAGLYGVCEECGTQIELERLKVQPAASVCIECKKEMEAEERKNASKYQ